MIPKLEYVAGLLKYHADTGLFTWKEARGCRAVGDIAGTKNLGRDRAYWMIKIDRRFYYAHKLAWLIYYGQWPEMLDHINGDGLDNRIVNLRLCDMAQNKANSMDYKNNRSGHKGVTWEKGKDRWVAKIQHRNKRITLGRFKTIELAAATYREAAKRLFGEFARP